MPTAAEHLTARRKTLGLPATVVGRTAHVKVTGEVCAWVEHVALGAGAPWRFVAATRGPASLASLNSTEVVLVLGSTVRVEIDKYGRWTRVQGNGGYWHRDRKPGQTESATVHYQREMREAMYRHVIAQPDPPEWAVAQRASHAAETHERENRAAEAAAAEATRRRAATHLLAQNRAVQDLIAAHPDEYETLLETRMVETALEAGSTWGTPG